MSDIRKIEKWVTEDGKEHRLESVARDWDLEIQKAKQATELFKTGMALAVVYKKVYGRECPDNLKMVTKDTLLTISYLQCHDSPRYKVNHFEPGGYVYVWAGKGDNGWPGPYGSTQTVSDISRYYDAQLSKGHRS